MRLKDKFFRSMKAGTWKRVLCIDPGVKNLGYAFWPEIKRGSKARTRAPSTSGLVTAPSFPAWEDAVHESQASWLVSFIQVHQVEHVVIEFAEMWGNSARSLQAAKKGDLFRLAYLVGALGEAAYALCDRKPVIVRPTVWKGDMPKDVMKRRVRRALHRKYKEHEYDAVAIGLRIMGRL